MSATAYDAIVVGAGHNGLVAAAYLAKAGLKTAVFEARHVVGGAAVTEELWPGFKVSRCAYVNSLFQPEIVRDLELKKSWVRDAAQKSVELYAVSRRAVSDARPGPGSGAARDLEVFNARTPRPIRATRPRSKRSPRCSSR